MEAYWVKLSDIEAERLSEVIDKLTPSGLFGDMEREAEVLAKRLSKEGSYIYVMDRREERVLNMLLVGMDFPPLSQRTRSPLPQSREGDRSPKWEPPKTLGGRIKGFGRPIYSVFVTYEEATRLRKIFEKLTKIAPYVEARRSSGRILRLLEGVRDIDYGLTEGAQLSFDSELDYKFFKDVSGLKGEL